MTITLRPLADGDLDELFVCESDPRAVELAAFLELERTRPLYGRVAEHNVGSASVLLRNGFLEVGSDTGFAPGLGREVVERIFRLED